MKFDLLHPREQLVQIMDRIYRYGLTTTSGGNLSILDENGDLWITPLNTLPIGEAEVQELEEKFG
jgi:L-fuculose-phosphate aldolase